MKQEDEILTSLHSLSSEKTEVEDPACCLACFLAGVHDLGKCTSVFQTQKGYQNSPDLDMALLERMEFIGLHGISGMNEIFNADIRKRMHHTITGEYLLHWAYSKILHLGASI